MRSTSSWGGGWIEIDIQVGGHGGIGLRFIGDRAQAAVRSECGGSGDEWIQLCPDISSPSKLEVSPLGEMEEVQDERDDGRGGEDEGRETGQVAEDRRRISASSRHVGRERSCRA